MVMSWLVGCDGRGRVWSQFVPNPPGLPGPFLAELRQGSEGWWGSGGLGFLMDLAMCRSKEVRCDDPHSG